MANANESEALFFPEKLDQMEARPYVQAEGFLKQNPTTLYPDLELRFGLRAGTFKTYVRWSRQHVLDLKASAACHAKQKRTRPAAAAGASAAFSGRSVFPLCTGTKNSRTTPIDKSFSNPVSFVLMRFFNLPRLLWQGTMKVLRGILMSSAC
jgi:hypothetical protein